MLSERSSKDGWIVAPVDKGYWEWSRVLRSLELQPTLPEAYRISLGNKLMPVFCVCACRGKKDNLCTECFKVTLPKPILVFLKWWVNEYCPFPGDFKAILRKPDVPSGEHRCSSAWVEVDAVFKNFVNK